MAAKTPDTKDEQDSAYNPAEHITAEKLAGTAASADIARAKGFTDDSANASEKVNGAEESPKELPNPGEIPFTGTGEQAQKQSFIAKARGVIGKNRAGAAIIGLLLTGAFGLSLLSPSLLLMQFRETLLDKFNDQLAAMDIRQTAILKKKLGKTTLDGCTKLSIRCKYKTLGDRHIKRLSAAGIEVKGDNTTLTGRTKPKEFVYKGDPIKAEDLLNRARSDPGLRSAMRHGYNPKFAAFSDAVANKVISNLGLKKSRTITPSSDKDKMKEDLKATASGEAAAGDGAPRKETIKDADGNDVTTYYDAAGNEIDEAQFNSANAAIDEIEKRANLAGDLKTTALKAGIKGAFTSVALGAGAVDSTCTAWVAMRVATFAAKIYGQRQLIRYAYEFLKAPDNVKANAVEPIENQIGPEEVSFLSTIITTPNSVGQTGTDSDGYKYAAYGDVFNPAQFDTSAEEGELTDKAVETNVIQNETSRYVNGQILPDNSVAKMLSILAQDNHNAADSFCGVVKSWKGQTVIWTATVLGLVGAFFTGGVSVGAGAAAQIGATAVASVAIALLIPKLADMAKGELIDGNENGNEAVNAAVSGMGGFNAQAAQGRALPVLNKKDAVEYNQVSQTVAADYNEVERYERGPLDPTSKDTFIGSIVNSLLPYTSKLSRGGSTITSTAALVTQSLGSIFTPKTSATEMKASEFEVCNDFEYEGLAADPFCNLRYGMSKESLQIDPEVVLDYMENGGYIEKDSEDGAPGGVNGSKYQEYIDQCIERETSIGDTLTEGDEGSGENCIQGRSGENEERNTMFRLFYIDTSVQDGMDSDFFAGSESAPTDDVGTLMVGSYNVRTSTLNNADFGDPDKVYDAEDEQRMAGIANIIEEKQLAIVGAQEVRGNEKQGLLRSLPSNYKGTPLSGGKHEMSDVIFYDSSLFKQVGFGTYTIPKQGARLREAIWAKLETASGNSVYVFNLHAGQNAGEQTTAAKATLAEIRRVVGSSGDPVIVMGDMNSNDVPPENTIKLTFEASGILTNTRDATTDRKNYNCDTISSPGDGHQDCGGEGARGSHRDQMWVSSKNDITINSWENIANAETLKLSDHNPIIVSMDIPSLGTGSTGDIEGGMAWPLDKKYWLSNRADFMGPHTAGSDTFTGVGRDLAVDISFPSDDGLPVYAMFSGKVTKDSLSGGHGLIISTPIQGGILEVAYAHGPRTNQNTEYNAGDEIMSIGCLGNCRGSHLHIDMAFNGKGVCPQDVFLALDSGQTPDFNSLTSKAAPGCEGRG